MSQTLHIFLVGLNWACYLIAALLFCCAVWYGIRIEIGKPGDNGRITMEIYAAKRLFDKK
jgi:hypothetical protein